MPGAVGARGIAPGGGRAGHPLRVGGGAAGAGHGAIGRRWAGGGGGLPAPRARLGRRADRRERAAARARSRPGRVVARPLRARRAPGRVPPGDRAPSRPRDLLRRRSRPAGRGVDARVVPVVRRGGPRHAPAPPGRAGGLLARAPPAPAPAPARGRSRAVNAVLFDVALTAYILAAVAAIGSLAGRRDQLAWVALLLTQAGFICHTGAVILRGIELRRLPVSTLAEMVSLLIWALALLAFWVERQQRIRPLSAFLLPVVLSLRLGLPTV